MPLRNWFSNHVGANLEIPELRCSRDRLSPDALLRCECPERPERIDDWEGDVLRLPPEIVAESLCS